MKMHDDPTVGGLRMGAVGVLGPQTSIRSHSWCRADPKCHLEHDLGKDSITHPSIGRGQPTQIVKAQVALVKKDIGQSVTEIELQRKMDRPDS